MRTEISSQSSQPTPETPQQSSLSLFDTAASVRKDEWVPVPLPAAVIGGGGIPSGHPNSRVSVVGEVTPFAHQHLSGFFTPPQKCLIGALLGVPKAILYGTNHRRICQVLQTNENLRRIQPIIGLIDGEVCELNREPFWVPLRATDKSTFFKERQHKKLKGFRQPCWTGEPRPPIEHNPTVQLSYHQALMRVLSGMRVNGDRQSGLYDVIVLGKSVKEVAEARGMNAASLAVTVSRVRAKM